MEQSHSEKMLGPRTSMKEEPLWVTAHCTSSLKPWSVFSLWWVVCAPLPRASLCDSQMLRQARKLWLLSHKNQGWTDQAPSNNSCVTSGKLLSLSVTCLFAKLCRMSGYHLLCTAVVKSLRRWHLLHQGDKDLAHGWYFEQQLKVVRISGVLFFWNRHEIKQVANGIMFVAP